MRCLVRRAIQRGSRSLSVAVMALAMLSTGCSEAPMAPLDVTALDAAEQRWAAHGSDSYHLVVRLRPPRFTATVYDLVVERGEVVRTERDGRPALRENAEDYSVPGLFAMLRTDLAVDREPREGDPPMDLRARFDPENGRLLTYRRTVGTARRRVLLIEALTYEPRANVDSRAAVR